jgi:hypothetical protein
MEWKDEQRDGSAVGEIRDERRICAISLEIRLLIHRAPAY